MFNCFASSLNLSAVVDQIEPDSDSSCDVPINSCASHPAQALCRYHNHIDVYEIEASLAVGPTFARHIGNRMYRGEYYALQIDADSIFVQDWDVDIIMQFEQAKNDMVSSSLSVQTNKSNSLPYPNFYLKPCSLKLPLRT